jgi:hypothetical protein
MDASLVRQGLLASAKAGTNTAVLSGVGDAATYESDDPIRVKTTAGTSVLKRTPATTLFAHGLPGMIPKVRLLRCGS